MERYLHIGGVVAVGFDPTSDYLLVITHSGRGVFYTRTWERVARKIHLAYPTGGLGIGIGPIDGQLSPSPRWITSRGTCRRSARMDGSCLSARAAVSRCTPQIPNKKMEIGDALRCGSS